MTPIILPPSWKQVSSPIPYQRCFRKFNGLVVLVGELEHEGDRWLHVSCSHKNKFPKWKELCEIKNIFIGDERRAIQIFPKKSEYVNIAEFCLHLWSCLDKDVIPNFASRTGTI